LSAQRLLDRFESIGSIADGAVGVLRRVVLGGELDFGQSMKTLPSSKFGFSSWQWPPPLTMRRTPIA